jgi:hypothetical protein
MTQLSLEQLTEQELAWLVGCATNCWEPYPAERIVQRVRNGQAMIYRIDEPTKALFILSPTDGGMFVEGIASENGVKYYKEIHEAIKNVAKASGAEALYTYVSRPAMLRLLSRTQAKPQATLFKETL